MPLTPHLITTTTNPNLFWNLQNKPIRTADQTVHVFFSEELVLRHWFSRDNGSSWNSTNIETYAAGQNRKTSITKDSNDNLYLVLAKGGGLPASLIITFRKGTVNKGVSPWTWAWGAETTLSGALINNDCPDIIIDPHDYINVVWVFLGNPLPVGNALRLYSLDGGATWLPAGPTPQKVFANNYQYYTTLVVDSQNNLYYFGSSKAASPSQIDFLKGQKWSYNSGPPASWSAGAVVNCSHVNTVGWSISRVLPNDKIVVLYPSSYGSTADIYFRKTTNARDISAWNLQVLIDTGVQYASFNLFIYNNDRIKVYYQKVADTKIYSRETLDGGINWEAAIEELNVGTQPCSINFSSTPIGGSIDCIWRNNAAANPRPVYYDFFPAIPLITDPTDLYKTNLMNLLDSGDVPMFFLSKDLVITQDGILYLRLGNGNLIRLS
jgi:hypothetical protein